MSVRRIMGTEVEYGISVPGQPTANAMLLSSQVVNAYGRYDARAPRPRWDFDEESPLRDARGFDLSTMVGPPPAEAEDDAGLANVILTN
ncbi:MAG: proteasome accessory factor PafA2 family protein, partial [Mycobacteriales bacterium]